MFHVSTPDMTSEQTSSFRGTLQRRSTLTNMTSLPAVREQGVDNLALDLYDEAASVGGEQLDRSAVSVQVEEDEVSQGDNLSVSSGKPLPSLPAVTSQLSRDLPVLKKAVSKAVSFAPALQAGKKSSDQSDFAQSWQSVEHYLREQIKDTDPESLTPNKKSFWKRTWFSLVVYAFLALLLVTGILMLASYWAIIRPHQVIQGQILLATVPPTTESAASALVNDNVSSSTTTESATTGFTQPAVTTTGQPQSQDFFSFLSKPAGLDQSSTSGSLTSSQAPAGLYQSSASVTSSQAPAGLYQSVTSQTTTSGPVTSSSTAPTAFTAERTTSAPSSTPSWFQSALNSDVLTGSEVTSLSTLMQFENEQFQFLLTMPGPLAGGRTGL